MSMCTVLLKNAKTETIFIPNINIYKNTSKGNAFCITRSFGMVHHACAWFIQCFNIQQWPARIAQLFPFKQ